MANLTGLSLGLYQLLEKPTGENRECSIKGMPLHEHADLRKPGLGRLPKIPWMIIGSGLLGIALLGGLQGCGSGGGTSLSATDMPTGTSAPTNTLMPSSTSTSIPLPTAKPLPSEITDAKGVSMRLVPAGSFTMGSNDGENDEKPVHEVYVDAFYMDKYEVTNVLYKACVNAGVCVPPQETSSRTRSSYYENSQYDDYPVINVDWAQANAYCEEWRGAQLPTEAEWEKAARGTDGRLYPWGNEFQCRNGNYDDEIQVDSYVVPGGPNCDGYVDTAPVGSYPDGKSPYGIFDLGGNVWEWVSSVYESYPYNANDGREDSSSSGNRAVRGGSFYYLSGYVRASSRSWDYPGYWLNYLGFRCSRPAGSP